MPTEKRKKSRVIVEGEISRRVNGSGAAPDARVPLVDQFPLTLPLYVRLLSVKRRVEYEGTEVDDESDTISVVRPLSVVGGCESEGVTFEEVVGRAGLISETETALDTAGLPIC